MPILSASAIAHPNIALIKYWGDIDFNLHIPANGSISMNLAELTTRTTVSFDPSLFTDQLLINGKVFYGKDLERVSALLERVRKISDVLSFATVESYTDFPMAAGIASSASAFAALSLAAISAAGLQLAEKDLSRLARTGSGSACRSIPGGFVEWQAGNGDEDSFAYSIAPPEHWDLVDCITLVSRAEKSVSSIVGHSIASTSILQPARVVDTPHRLSLCREAILKCDFDQLAKVVELDSNLMHSVMLTSTPPLLYWQPSTISIMNTVHSWRKTGKSVCYSIDAGPNVHVLCPASQMEEVRANLRHLPGVIEVLVAHPGGPTTLDNPNQ